ncbi:MAG: hypothetical protein K6G11_09760, partial [Lachnospiraceae bacterium]|nr:hypothetical protein [Lachnospiraceae bacterium]
VVFLKSWIEEYREMDFKTALAAGVTNYYVPYNIILIIISRFWSGWGFMLGGISIIHDYLIAYVVYKMILHFQGDKANKIMAAYASIGLLLMPWMFVDSAAWKQCDSIYAFYAILCLYLILKEKNFRAICAFSIGFCFKLQIIFLLPFIFIIWVVKNNWGVFYLFLVPLFYFVAGLPSVLAGGNAELIYKTYLEQTNTYKDFTFNYPNFYVFFTYIFKFNKWPVIMFAILALLTIFVFAGIQKDKLNNIDLIGIAGFSVWTAVMFMPCMHERYDYVALIIIWVYAIVFNNGFLGQCIIMQVCMSLIYIAYCFFTFMFGDALSFAYCPAYIWFAINFFKYVIFKRDYKPKSAINKNMN